MVARNPQVIMPNYDLWKRRAQQISLPGGIVDLDALEHNIDTLLEPMRGSGQTIRVASKSVRVPKIMRSILDRCVTASGAAAPLARGLMTFHIDEVKWLFDNGFDDFLMGYPFATANEARTAARLAKAGATVRPTVDSAEQLAFLQEAARAEDAILNVCIDLDASWRPLNGKLHLGVRRSPIRSVADALALAAAIHTMPNLKLDAVLAYEAQIAGLADVNLGSRHLDPIRAMVKQKSKPYVLALRRDVVAALRQTGYEIRVVNGGGTGSIRWTATDPSVTETTVGSGFLCPHLFDGYNDLDLRPAAFAALSVVRRPDPKIVTCAGGGYIASGATGTDRSPRIHQPHGLSPLSAEGFGEVQTPLSVSTDCTIAIGDPVIIRHAKAGELFERFGTVHAFRGDELVWTDRSYRGHGLSFM